MPSNKVQLKKLRCPIRGMTDQYTSDTKPEDVAKECGFCFEHKFHEAGKINVFCCVSSTGDEGETTRRDGVL